MLVSDFVSSKITANHFGRISQSSYYLPLTLVRSLSRRSPLCTLGTPARLRLHTENRLNQRSLQSNWVAVNLCEWHTRLISLSNHLLVPIQIPMDFHCRLLRRLILLAKSDFNNFIFIRVLFYFPSFYFLFKRNLLFLIN